MRRLFSKSICKGKGPTGSHKGLFIANPRHRHKVMLFSCFRQTYTPPLSHPFGLHKTSFPRTLPAVKLNVSWCIYASLVTNG